MNIRSKCLTIALLALSFLKINAQYKIPEWITYASILISDEKNNPIGSGFICDDSSSLYIVTASHVLCDIHNPEIILHHPIIYIDYYFSDPANSTPNRIVIFLKKLYELNLVKFDKKNDACVLKIATKKGEAEFKNSYSFDFLSFVASMPSNNKHIQSVSLRNNCLPFANVRPFYDIFSVGFPVSLGLLQTGQYNYNTPLYTKGIVSGKYFDKKTIIVDAPAFPGNSGGPVFTVDVDKLKIFLIGIVIQYIPFDQDLYKQMFKLPDHSPSPNPVNSGYTVVLSVDHIKTIVEEFNK